jgi:hypothetical protein
MALAEIQHHLSLLENPLSSRLCRYTTTVALSLDYRTRAYQHWEDDAAVVECSQKDEAAASILKLLVNLSQVELNFPPFDPRSKTETWQWWPQTTTVLGGLGRAAAAVDGVPRPFIRALALHAVRPPMDHLIAQILAALAPNLSALVLATDANYIYKSRDADFGASWAAIQQHATQLATLVVSGVPVAAQDGPWACSRSLRSLDITSAPGLTPTLAHALICQFPSLRSVALRSIRLGFGAALPPRDPPGVSRGPAPPTAAASSGVLATPPRNPVALQDLTLSSLDIDFVAALSALGTAALHLQDIHRSKTLLHILKQPRAFLGLGCMVVGNEGEMNRGIFGWLGAEETEELRAVCKERGCIFEDERFSRTR